MHIRIALSLLVMPAFVAACRRDSPPVEPASTSSTASGAGGADTATASSTSATSTSSGGAPAGCIEPAPAPLSCRDHGDCYRRDLCTSFACDPAGHCIYRLRDADRPGGVVGCDPGGTAPGYWSCQSANAIAPGGYCCPDAAPLSPAVSQ